MILSHLLAICLSTCLASWPQPDEGIRPIGADGKPLNLNFETGTLKDWIAQGLAFAEQPVRGDTVHSRRADMHSQHQGDYWIGGFERLGDKPTGTLTSAAFRVTHPWASCLVGGGPHSTTCVEIVLKKNDQVIHRVAGAESENLQRVALDMQPYQNQEIFIRIVDRHTGHWGHINFDDFLFHSRRPTAQAAKAPAAPPAPDQFRFAGLDPDKAAAAMTVPEGFEVKLFAGEPAVHQPIAFCIDDRGRLWVAEAYCYPIRRPENQANDRILILEDTNGDGHFDKSTVFMERLNLVSGIEVGFGGVWIGAAPNLLFVPVREGEDKPAGAPQVLLDGWGWQDTHETLNTFIWGPDGWLYGCHGVFTHSRVGKPGMPNADRTPINAGIWRYHPTKHQFEVFAEGTSNPWGFDFNDQGQAFCEACVIPHAFHIIQGARFLRQAGSHFNPHIYADINTIADHFHYLGATPHGGNNVSDKAGGGHAHCGLMVYLGGAWPSEYRNQMFMGNIHGRRINVDLLKQKGSGYVASHGPDFLLANDAWARFINFQYGPDGNVYLIDWYDKQACHRREPEIWDRSNGRIYKISYRGTKPTSADVKKLTDEELVKALINDNDWWVRHARRVLQERGGNPGLHLALQAIAFNSEKETTRLRGLWALHVTGGLTEERILRAMADSGPFLRAWAIQLALENREASQAIRTRMAELAKSDGSQVVRKYIASALQRLPVEQRWPILEGLVAHNEDAGDHNLPLLYWYAMEPLADVNASRALDLAEKSVAPIPGFMARRVGSIGTSASLQVLIERLGKLSDDGKKLVLMQSLRESLKGRRSVDAPRAWAEVLPGLLASPDQKVKTQALALGVLFGDVKSMAELRSTLASAKIAAATRLEALGALLAARDPELPGALRQLLSDNDLRREAIRGLAAFDDPKTPDAILGRYAGWSAAEKRDALATLASRASHARSLLDAVASKKVPASDLSADLIRQLRNFKDKSLDQRIAEVWGVVRATPAEKLRQQQQLKAMVLKPGPASDLMLGRAIFVKTCGQCHALFGVGGAVGPDLTGSNRANLDYLLENSVDPSAVIPKEYASTLLELHNGRLITGIVKSETPTALTVMTATETITVPVHEVAQRQLTSQSMMPEDQLKPMSEHEIRSLIAYLQSPVQTPILANSENAKDFFNGKDLSGWDGDKSLWSVENGEIVGKSKGIKRNSFLKSHLAVEDFRLTLKAKLTPNSENSGIQFRSEPLPDGEMRGPQADMGKGWWGKLYEESARGILWNKSSEALVRENDWNDYEIIARGDEVKTYLNGKLCVDLKDPKISRRGIIGLQIHSGGPLEVRFKDIKLEVLKP